MSVYVGTTVDEAIAIGLKDLGLSKEQVAIEVIDEGKKGFLGMGRKNAQVKIEPVVSETTEEVVVPEKIIEEIKEVMTDTPEENVHEAIEEVEESAAPNQETLENEGLSDEEALKKVAIYVTEVSQKLGAPALVRMKREDGVVIFQLDTKKQGILIGKHGKTLNALQYLVQVYVHRIAKNKLSVVLNVGDYREKRQAILQRLADRTAQQVKRSQRPVFLEPMPAFERKQIHAALSNVPYVQTHSEGDEPYRYLVVEPVKTL